MMLVRFKEMAAVSSSSDVVKAMGDFFYNALKYSLEEDENVLRNVVLKNETLIHFPEFLKPNFRVKGSATRKLYDSLTALDVIKLGFWYLNKQKKADSSLQTQLLVCFTIVTEKFRNHSSLKTCKSLEAKGPLNSFVRMLRCYLDREE